MHVLKQQVETVTLAGVGNWIRVFYIAICIFFNRKINCFI